MIRTAGLSALVLWIVLLSVWEFTSAELLTRVQMELVSGFDDADLLEPGGMWLLDALRLNLPRLAETLRESALWWIALLPLQTLLLLGLFRSTWLGRQVTSRLSLRSAVRFVLLTLGRAIAQGLLLGLLGAATYAALQSEGNFRLQATLGSLVLWFVGRTFMDVYFDLSRQTAAGSQGTARDAHQRAAELLWTRPLTLATTRALASLFGPGLAALLLREAEQSALTGGAGFAASVASVHLAFVLSVALHATWLVWAGGLSSSPSSPETAHESGLS